jgi:hypothetical protein
VYAGNVGVDDNLRVLSGGPPPDPESVLASLGRYNSVPAGASNVMVGAHALRDVGPFDTGLRTNEDWDMWLRLASRRQPACVSRPLVAYRFLPGWAVGHKATITREPELLALRYGIPIDRAALHRRAAWTMLWSGRRLEALSHYARAIAHGDLKSLGRIPVAFLPPALRYKLPAPPTRRGAEVRRWRAEARSWLEDLRLVSQRPTVGSQ